MTQSLCVGYTSVSKDEIEIRLCIHLKNDERYFESTEINSDDFLVFTLN